MRVLDDSQEVPHENATYTVYTNVPTVHSGTTPRSGSRDARFVQLQDLKDLDSTIYHVENR